MHISQLTKTEEVNLLDVYLSGLNFARDVKAYVSKPEVKRVILDVTTTILDVLLIAVVVRVVMEA